MPRRLTATKDGTHKVLKNISYESTVVGWLLHDGWQVFTPVVDNSHKTDVLISDGPNYHRVQVKTLESASEDTVVENRWKDSNVDVVVFFAKNSDWGYVIPAFTENSRKLKTDGHQKFKANKAEFLKAFHKV